jgi:hypothetical protein
MEAYQQNHRNDNTYFRPRALFVRVNRKSPCPVCHKPDNCNISVDGRIAYCRRVRGDRQGTDGGWTHILSSDAPTPTFTVTHGEQKRADIDHIDGVYSTLLRGHLVLSEPHRAALLARGLSAGEISRCGYASAPLTPDDGNRIACELSAFALGGVPGFYQHGGEWRMSSVGPGIIIPIRDEYSRVVGCQVRRDAGSPRYLWFSSAGKPCGTSSGSPVHHARAHLLHNACEVILSEGSLKADIAAYYLNVPVVAAAGVSNFGPDFAENLKAKFPNIKTCFVAFDSDWRIKLPVKTALERLMRNLSSVGFRVRVRTWPPQHKGIDDYLLTLASSQSKGVPA